QLNDRARHSGGVCPGRHSAMNGGLSLRQHAGCGDETSDEYTETTNDETDTHEDTPPPRGNDERRHVRTDVRHERLRARRWSVDVVGTRGSGVVARGHARGGESRIEGR